VVKKVVGKIATANHKVATKTTTTVKEATHVKAKVALPPKEKLKLATHVKAKVAAPPKNKVVVKAAKKK
jgi:hypothetical protein